MKTIYFALHAEAQAIAADRAWRELPRSVDDAFETDLAAAMEKARAYTENYQVYATIDGKSVRRVLMPRVNFHIYYVYEEDVGAVRIIAVWGATRRTGPSLKR